MSKEEINKEKDPEKIIDKIPGDVVDEMMKTFEDADPKLARDMIVEPPKRKKKGSKKRERQSLHDDGM